MISIDRLAALVAVAPSPNPTPGLRDGLDESIISPGLAGFLAVFGIALAAVLLFYSLTGKLRRVKVRGAGAAEPAVGASGPGPVARGSVVDGDGGAARQGADGASAGADSDAVRPADDDEGPATPTDTVG